MADRKPFKPRTYWTVFYPNGSPSPYDIRELKREAVDSFVGPTNLPWSKFYDQGYTVGKVLVSPVETVSP